MRYTFSHTVNKGRLTCYKTNTSGYNDSELIRSFRKEIEYDKDNTIHRGTQLFYGGTCLSGLSTPNYDASKLVWFEHVLLPCYRKIFENFENIQLDILSSIPIEMELEEKKFAGSRYQYLYYKDGGKYKFTADLLRLKFNDKIPQDKRVNIAYLINHYIRLLSPPWEFLEIEDLDEDPEDVFEFITRINNRLVEDSGGRSIYMGSYRALSDKRIKDPSSLRNVDNLEIILNGFPGKTCSSYSKNQKQTALVSILDRYANPKKKRGNPYRDSLGRFTHAPDAVKDF